MSSIEEKKSLPPVPANLHANNIKSWIDITYEEVLSALDNAFKSRSGGDKTPFVVKVKLCQGTYYDRYSADIDIIRKKLSEVKYSTSVYYCIDDSKRYNGCRSVMADPDAYLHGSADSDNPEYREYYLEITTQDNQIVHQDRGST